MTSSPYDVQIPATEIQIAEAIRVSDHVVADVIRRLVFERDQLRTANHHMRGLLETAVDAHECGGSVTATWWEKAERAAGGDDAST